MTQPKTLTPQEALRALADGKALRHKGWGVGLFVCLEGDRLKDESASKIAIAVFDNFTLYTEPKPKRKVAPYLVQHGEDKNPEQTPEYFADEDDLRSYYSGRLKVIRRVAELECEIEDRRTAGNCE